MKKQIVLNCTAGETRVAVLEGYQLAEVYIERLRNRGVVGNIYKARVQRVLPGMQAAFVDIGFEKAAFLHASDFFDELSDLPPFAAQPGANTEPSAEDDDGMEGAADVPAILEEFSVEPVHEEASRGAEQPQAAEASPSLEPGAPGGAERVREA